MTGDPEIEAWFNSVRRPGEAELRRVRAVILGADARITEFLKYGTVTFAYRGDMASFVQHAKPTATLMFNRGARIPGDFPHLAGTGPTARFMRFRDESEVEAHADELRAVVVAWCDLMDST
jgi:hypothetical protein